MAGLLLLLAAVAVFALTAACGGDDSDGPSATASATPSGGASATPTPAGETPAPTPESGTPTPTLGPSYAAGCNAAGLTAETDVGTGQYAAGEAIPISMTMKNCGDNEVHLYYQTDQRYDFFATNENDVEVWRWSDGQAFAETPGEVVLPVGESVTYQETWDQKDPRGRQVPAGRYKISTFSVGCVSPASTNCTFGPAVFVDIR